MEKGFLKTKEIDKIFSAGLAHIDIVSSSKLRGTPQELSSTKGALKALIESCIGKKSILSINWSGDGGIFVSDASNGCDDLVSVFNQVVELMPFFNKSRGRLNCLQNDEIHVRVVCHASMMTWTGDLSTLSNDALNILCKNEREVGIPDHVVLTDEVYQQLSADLQSRLSSMGNPDAHIGACFVLDANLVNANLEVNDSKSETKNTWIARSIKEKSYDSINIFGYTNESLSEYLTGPVDCKIRVLGRNWLSEQQDEYVYNQMVQDENGKLVPKHKNQWMKSNIIKSIALSYMGSGSTIPFSNNIDFRFYSDKPWIKGALLKNTSSGKRSCYISIYGFKSEEFLSNSPYRAREWVGIWLNEDKSKNNQGPKSLLLDAIESRFEQLWSNGLKYEDVLREEDSSEIKAKADFSRIWSTENSKPYLILYPVEKHSVRPMPKANTEDLFALRVIEKTLQKNSQVYEIYPMYDQNEAIEKVKNWNGHIISICFRTWVGEIKQAIEKCSIGYTIDHIEETKDRVKPFIVDKTRGISYFSPMDKEPAETKDYCLVARINRIDSADKIFLIAGIHGLGTWGGSDYLSNPENFEALLANTHNKDFALILEAIASIDLLHTNVSVYVMPRIIES